MEGKDASPTKVTLQSPTEWSVHYHSSMILHTGPPAANTCCSGFMHLYAYITTAYLWSVNNATLVCIPDKGFLLTL